MAALILFLEGEIRDADQGVVQAATVITVDIIGAQDHSACWKSISSAEAKYKALVWLETHNATNDNETKRNLMAVVRPGDFCMARA